MLFESALILVMGIVATFLIGVPFYKLVRQLIPKKRDPLAEARARLEQAQLEAEAARLNKRVEEIYEETYSDVLGDDEEEDKKRIGR